jgi:hypothetical protein
VKEELFELGRKEEKKNWTKSFSPLQNWWVFYGDL